jgi:hypothetical protein
MIVVTEVERADDGDAVGCTLVSNNDQFTGSVDEVTVSRVADQRLVLVFASYSGTKEGAVGEEWRSASGRDGDGGIVVRGQHAALPVNNAAERTANINDATCTDRISKTSLQVLESTRVLRHQINRRVLVTGVTIILLQPKVVTLRIRRAITFPTARGEHCIKLRPINLIKTSPENFYNDQV